jgi:hypothetical protein
LNRLRIGLIDRSSPSIPGRHDFGLSDIRLVQDPRSEESRRAWPVVLFPPPPQGVFTCYPPELHLGLTRRVVGLSSACGSVWPQAQGWGGDQAAPYRWIPLVEAVGRKGDVIGWPAACFLVPGKTGGRQLWGWVGLDYNVEDLQAYREVLQLVMDRLADGALLYGAGNASCWFEPRDLLLVSARWEAVGADDTAMRVVAELLSSDGQMLRRVVSPGLYNPHQDREIQINLGRVPVAADGVRDYVLRIALESTAGAQRVLDEVRQPIKVSSGPRPEAQLQWMKPSGARLVRNKRHVFLLGVAFEAWSAYVPFPGAMSEQWLEPGEFDAALVQQNLDELERSGINTVQLTYNRASQAAALQYALHEAARRRMNVLLQLDSLTPLACDLEWAASLIRAIDLARQDAVIALQIPLNEDDLDWFAETVDQAWEQWLIEQYGSLRRAEERLDASLMSRQQVVFPGLGRLSDNSRSLAAACRRFLDDWISRRLGAIRRFLRANGCPQMLTLGIRARPAQDWTLPLDPAMGHVHQDFISLGGGWLEPGRTDMASVLFMTAYARGVSQGKPVVLLNAGASVYDKPLPGELKYQAWFFDTLLDHFQAALGSGLIAFRFAPGNSEVERDWGIVNPGGSWRPVGDVFRRKARPLMNETRRPHPWRDRTMRQYANPRGFLALVEDWDLIYRDEAVEGELEEIRLVGAGKTTAAMPLTTVGGSPYEAPAPLECANAEWGQIFRAEIPQPYWPGETVTVPVGSPVTLVLINTGVAEWEASKSGQERTVWVRAISESGTVQELPVAKVLPGENDSIAWRPEQPGTWRLRPFIRSVGEFGQALTIKVEP